MDKWTSEQEIPESRKSLLKAAATLFAEHGYNATGVQQITDVAGINKAMLYYYFGSKDALYDYLISIGIAMFERAAAAAEEAEGPVEDRIRRFLTVYFSVVTEHPELASIIYREIVGAGERARQTVADHFSQSVQRLAAVLATAVSRKELPAGMDTLMSAYSLFGLSNMFITRFLVNRTPLDIQSHVEYIVGFFFHGVGGGEANLE
jgi:AcrR family transcriptional regulator